MLNLSKMKKYLMAKGMEKLLPALSSHSPETLVSMIEVLKNKAIERMAASHTGDAATLQMRTDAANGFFKMAQNNLPHLSPETQKKLCFNLFFNTMHLGDEARERYNQEHGEYPPFFLTISPSMVCNLRCTGCYAWKYDKKEQLSFDEMDRLLTEAKEKMGIYFVTLTGGEPTMYEHLFPLVEKHDDMFFQMYTHGHNIDKAFAARLAKVGNLYPAISIEGGRKETDDRRGEGAYDKVLLAMDNLKEAKCLFGCSVTHTRWNHESICSGSFFDEIIAHGAAFGWYFQYIPYGKEPNLDMTPTPEQRYERMQSVQRIRREKPLLIFDFWNDGESVCGCMAFGRKYVHITANGNVEPCVFVHFALDNIRKKSLVEIITSDMMKDARSRQPFHKDLRRPCPVIDHPHELKDLVEKHNMFANDNASMPFINEMHGAIKEQADAYKDYLAKMDAEAKNECSSCSSCHTKSAQK